MIIRSMMADRKLLVKELEKRLGIHAEYKGAPAFAYTIGDYTVRRDGHIEVADEKADLEMLRALNQDGFVDASWDVDRERMVISLPYDGHTGATLTNLVHMIEGKRKLINKSICCGNAFFISERFLEALREKEPETVDDFLRVVEVTEANKENLGVTFETDCISFTGFTVVENAEKVKAYMDLAALMNKMSKEQKRVRITTTETDNEKYAFRVWLIRLGMNGNEYKTSRKYLLENLSGNSAFRTKEQEEIFKENHRVKKTEEA